MPLLTVYGAPPAGVNWWEGNRFMMPGLLMPAPPPPPAAPLLDASQWVPHARQWTTARSNDPGGQQGGATGIMDQRVGTPENPGVTRSSWDMAKETGGMLGRAALGALNPFNGWGSAIGTVAGLGLGIPGLGTIGGMFDTARAATNALDRWAGDLHWDSEGNLVNPSAPPLGDAPWGGFFGGGWTEAAPNASGSPDLDGVLDGGYDFGPSGNDLGSPAAHAAGDANVGGTPAYWKGGKIGGRGLLDVDPPGPDDTVIAAQRGEGVVTRAAMRRHPGLLAAWNRGDTNAMRSLLRTGAGRGDRPRPCGC